MDKKSSIRASPKRFSNEIHFEKFKRKFYVWLAILLSIARKKTGTGTGKEKKGGNKKVRKIIAPNEWRREGFLPSPPFFMRTGKGSKKNNRTYTHQTFFWCCKKVLFMPPFRPLFCPRLFTNAEIELLLLFLYSVIICEAAFGRHYCTQTKGD